MKIIIPSKIDLEKIIFKSQNKYYHTKELKLNNYDFDVNKLNIDVCYYILHYIFRKTILRMNRDNVTIHNLRYNSIYVEISSKFLESLARNYKNYMLFFCSNNINSDPILYRKSYEKGKPYSYCINLKFISNDFKIIEIKDKFLLKKLKVEFKEKITGNVVKTKLSALKNDFFNKIYFDLNELDLYVAKNEEIKDYYSLLTMFDFINGKKWLTIKNETDGRLHSNLTVLRKKHRTFLRTKMDEKFCELDLSNCVPLLFLMSMAKPKEYIERFEFAKNQKNVILIFGKILTQFITKNCLNLLQEELYPLLESAVNGRFYQYINRNNNFSKIEILSYFFSENDQSCNVQQYFAQYYPNFHYFVTTIKNTETWVNEFSCLPQYAPNKLLAHYLFHLEAELILFYVCKAIKKYNRKITVITIHDCVIVPENYSEEVIAIIKKIFKEKLGIEPSIKKISNTI